MLDLSNPQHRDLLASRIKNDIDDYCVKTYHEGHRKHLGASIMGEACDRKLWYNFRWVKDQVHTGRMYRLFNVGHMAEPRLISYLRGIGFEVWEHQPLILHWHPESGSYFFKETFDAGDGLVSDVTGIAEHEAAAKAQGLKRPQFRISGHNGHYGGSLDGMCKAPERYELSENLIFLNEFKTNGTGAGFTNVGAQGVEKAKPRHYAQMSQYGYKYNLRYGLYLIENKNDSDLCPQIVELDWKLGAQQELRAGDIINSKTPPARIAENPSYFDCKYCEYQGPCHHNEPVEINCRSCKLSDPIENGQWYCNRWKAVIPEDAIAKGCEGHTSVNS
jgi:hypothetical protein